MKSVRPVLFPKGQKWRSKDLHLPSKFGLYAHLAGRQRELPGKSLPVAIRASSYMVIGANLLPPGLPLAEQHTHQYLD